jgi:hypothetical protein
MAMDVLSLFSLRGCRRNKATTDGFQGWIKVQLLPKAVEGACPFARYAEQ